MIRLANITVKFYPLLGGLLLALLLCCSSADARQTHVFLERFGGPSGPAFANARVLTIDQTTGDLLVGDQQTQTVSRFHEDATAAPFSARGTNVISGLNFLSGTQIAVDRSGTATDGDIYITQPTEHLVDVFSESGELLGQITGAGSTPFNDFEPCGVAVDGAGKVYVGLFSSRRVDVFKSSQNPLKTSDYVPGESISVPFESAACQLQLSSGSVASAYFSDAYKLNPQSGAVIYSFDVGRPPGDVSEDDVANHVATIAVDPANGHVFTTHWNDETIHEYDVSSDAGAVEVSSFQGTSSSGIAVDEATGKVYETSGGEIRVYSALVGVPDVVTSKDNPLSNTALELRGSVNPDGVPLEECYFEYGATSGLGSKVPCESPDATEIGAGHTALGVHANLAGLEPEALYYVRLVAKNEHDTIEGALLTAKTPSKPKVIEEWAESVAYEEAVVSARINPENAPTEYVVDWGPTDNYGDQTRALPAGHDDEPHMVSVTLENLSPGTIYHYRVAAVNTVGSGAGTDHVFTTFEASGDEGGCPNESVRIGASRALPDCRAYEMVSPPDKKGGDIIAPINVTGFENRLDQSSVGGDAIAYSSYRAFAGSKSASYISQYIASRTPSGWSTEPLAAQRDKGLFPEARKTENEFKAFSPDLCHAWVLRESEPALAPGAVPGFPNLYRRENCGGSYEALTTVPAPTLAPREFDPALQGYSADGSAAVFQVNDKLTPDATAGKYQVYEAAAGGLSLVCVLPDSTAYPGDCSVGSPSISTNEYPNRSDSVRNAMSEDGSRIYWSTTEGQVGLGKLYLRLNGSATVEVSGKASGAEARFWQASPSGSKALFTIEDGTAPITVLNHNLYLYDLVSETTSLIAGKVIGVVAASESLARVYFVSEEAIGGNGTAGQPNLYLNEEGTNTFIATLSGEDVYLEGLPSDVTPLPVFHSAQATPNGDRLAFISTAPLTQADTVDSASGEPDSEVFTYAAATRTLNCVSCSPAGTRPHGEHIQAPGNSGYRWTAASLPLGENQLYTPRTLSADGKLLFFTSYTDLIPQDDNGRADVYEWEQAGASSSCKDESDPEFYAAAGGCLFLISTGNSPQDSELVDSGPNGRDVFFTTKEGLAPQDIDLQDIYDARVNGGFPSPPAPVPPCEGEDCQPSLVAPAFASSGSGAVRPGNPPKSGCPKKKHRVVRSGKERCISQGVKRHKGKKKPPKHKSRRQGQ